MKSTLCILAYLALGLFCSAGTVTLQWDHNSSSNLTGFKIYYGQTPGLLDRSNVVAGATNRIHTVTNLAFGKWYFAATAFIAAPPQDIESGKSSPEAWAVITPTSPNNLIILSSTNTVSLMLWPNRGFQIDGSYDWVHWHSFCSGIGGVKQATFDLDTTLPVQFFTVRQQ